MGATKKKTGSSKQADDHKAVDKMEDVPSSAAAGAPSKRGQKRAASPTPIADAPATDSTASAKRTRTRASTTSAVAASSSSSSSSSSSALPTPESLASLHPGGEVFSIGSGDCSQLGNGPDEDKREHKKPTIISTIVDKKISVLAIAAGSLHNLILDNKRAVWSWGCNDDFALGRETDEWFPEPVVGPLGKGSNKGGIPVVQITCGASHSLALTADGDAYCFGTFRDANGVIGFSETVEAAKEPMKMAFGLAGKHPKIVMIASGEHHDLALTENGEGQNTSATPLIHTPTSTLIGRVAFS